MAYYIIRIQGILSKNTRMGLQRNCDCIGIALGLGLQIVPHLRSPVNQMLQRSTVLHSATAVLHSATVPL